MTQDDDEQRRHDDDGGKVIDMVPAKGPNGRPIYTGEIPDGRKDGQRDGRGRTRTRIGRFQLPPMIHKFVMCYVGEAKMNADKAAEMAGYSTPRARAPRLMKRPDVLEAISILTADAFKKSGMSPERILGHIDEVRARAMEEGQLVVALKALELLGKHYALFTDRIEHVRSVEDVSQGELVNLFDDLVKKLPEGDKKALLAAAGRKA